MNTNGIQGGEFGSFVRQIRFQRGLAFGIIIVTALLAFEIFNYSTTDYALADLLGDLTFMGVPWSTILSIAFCGIDFAGIARLFTSDDNSASPHGEVWYLFGAWLLAATMNAMLTWWGVSLAVANHETLGGSVVDRSLMLRVVPIFVSILVWLIRVLIIGTFSVAGDRLFGGSGVQVTNAQESYQSRPQLPAQAQLPLYLEQEEYQPDTLAARPRPTATRPAPQPRTAQRPPVNAPTPVAARPAAATTAAFRPAPKPSSRMHTPPENSYAQPPANFGASDNSAGSPLPPSQSSSPRSASLANRSGHNHRP